MSNTTGGPIWTGQKRVSRVSGRVFTVGAPEECHGMGGWTVTDPNGHATWLSTRALHDNTDPVVDMVESQPTERKHGHYFRNVAHLREVDIYRVLDLFGVTDQALGHAIKKLVVPGMRGGGKTTRKDIEEAVDTLQRRLEMMDEDEAANPIQVGLDFGAGDDVTTVRAANTPWYPDDSGGWIELPDNAMGRASFIVTLTPSTKVEVMTRKNRLDKDWHSYPKPRDFWDFDAQKTDGYNIVAYKVVGRV